MKRKEDFTTVDKISLFLIASFLVSGGVSGITNGWFPIGGMFALTVGCIGLGVLIWTLTK